MLHLYLLHSPLRPEAPSVPLSLLSLWRVSCLQRAVGVVAAAGHSAGRVLPSTPGGAGDYSKILYFFCTKCRRQWTPACGFTCCLWTEETTRLSGDISTSSGDMRTVRDDGESTGLSVNRFTRGKMRLSDFDKGFKCVSTVETFTV